MTLQQILADVQLAEQVWPELEAFYAAAKVLFVKIETLKAGSPPPVPTVKNP